MPYIQRFFSGTHTEKTSVTATFKLITTLLQLAKILMSSN